jgi:uncharacterized protein YndB with AHSA1/START domain
MVSCTDERYRSWWPGTHLQLHSVGRATGGVGDVVVMNEFVGERRLRLRGVVEAVEPGRRLVWRFRKLVPLPARLSLELTPVPGGVSVRHTVTAGWPGIGRGLDPLLRLYFTPRFRADLDAHVRTEFPLLRDHLRRGAAPPTDD